jgi:glutathione S-transferase
MTPGTAYATSLAAVTPLSKSPAILLDGRLIYESGAIITELLAQFPHAGVEGTPSQQSTFWSYFSEGGVMLFFQPARFLTTGASLIKKGLSAEEQKGSEALLKWMNGWSNNHINMALGQVEKYLADHEWFSGTDQIGLGDVSRDSNDSR